MSPATWPREALAERLLHLDPAAGRFRDATIADLPSFVLPGDVFVVNDGATMPASLEGRTRAGAFVEARLWNGERDGEFHAILFGTGTSRDRTEDRGPAPRVEVGETIAFGQSLSAVVESLRPESLRLVSLRFVETGARFWQGLYARGKPIQYSYVRAPLSLFHAQTRYASRPFCAELASAGRPLSFGLIFRLKERGARFAWLTHAAGISSTGDAELDALLPDRERFDIPLETVRTIDEAKALGRRVVAVGTTVARALEGCAAANGGRLVAGPGSTDLLLSGDHRPRIVDGLLTGMHEPTESHFRLLASFAPVALLERAHEHASNAGYLSHEFGDSSLILSQAA